MKTHTCDELITYGLIIRGPQYNDAIYWEIEDDPLEEEGVSIQFIRFCPFCGIELAKLTV